MTQAEIKPKKVLMTAERVNFILAVCAIVISAASFYATYLQANAAERQVKAATWPWLKFVTGNVNADRKTSEISFTLENSGTGPALIKYVKYTFQEDYFFDVNPLINACCTNLQAFYSTLRKLQEKTKNINFFSEFGWMTTSHAHNTLLASGEEIKLLTLPKTKYNLDFWQKLDKARFQLDVSICYCSLLEQCFISNGRGKVNQVAQCDIPPKRNKSEVKTTKLPAAEPENPPADAP